MKKTLILLSAVIVFFVAGCKFFVAGCKEKEQVQEIPPGSFRVSIEDLYEGTDLLVKHFTIEAHGEKTVKISKKTGHGLINATPALDTELMVAEVVFVADLVKTSAPTNMLKLLIQITERRGISTGNSVGAPNSFPAEAENLADILELTLSDGLYPLGQDIVIGKFQGEPIVLSVK